MPELREIHGVEAPIGNRGSNYRHSFITTERIFCPLFQKLLGDEYEAHFDNDSYIFRIYFRRIFTIFDRCLITTDIRVMRNIR